MQTKEENFAVTCKYSQRLLKLKSTSLKNIIHELMNYIKEKQ